jgi:hypothetical protein
VSLLVAEGESVLSWLSPFAHARSCERTVGRATAPSATSGPYRPVPESREPVVRAAAEHEVLLAVRASSIHLTPLTYRATHVGDVPGIERDADFTVLPARLVAIVRPR